MTWTPFAISPAILAAQANRRPTYVCRLRYTAVDTSRPGWSKSGYGAWVAGCRRCRWEQIAGSHSDALRRAHLHCEERTR